MAEHLTERNIKSLPAPASGNKLFYDDEIKGFALRVTSKGARAFVVNYYLDGKERRITIGAYPDWTVTAARARAKEIKQQVDVGADPLEKRISRREAPTVADLFKEYDAKHLPKKVERSAKDDRSMWHTYILPRLGNKKVIDLTAEDADDLHAFISQTKTVRANRVIEVLRKAINLAIRWKWCTENPCVGVHRNHEEKREYFLKPGEIERLAEALDQHPQKQSCNAIKMLLLTGARKSEVLKATWSMFDFEGGIWTKPSHHTKTKKKHVVPLSILVVDLLTAIRDNNSHPVYVFPGRVKDQPITDVKRTWTSICKMAGINEVRIHDLRHTYASLLISRKATLSVVGALLAHTQTQTTARYAHLYDDVLREATELASTAVQGDRKAESGSDGTT